MSKSKDLTGSTQPSLSDASTEVLERPSSPSARTDNTQTYTQSTSQPLPPMLSTENGELTTPPTTETVRQHGVILKALLSYLLKNGWVKKYKVLSLDGVTVLKLRYEFDMSQWTQDLEPK